MKFASEKKTETNNEVPQVIDDSNLSKLDYAIGDIIKVNNIEFYVIQNSYDNIDYVVALKKTPFLIEEVRTYGVGHINRNTQWSKERVNQLKEYGGMTYYSSNTCGYENGNATPLNNTECSTDYNLSDIKYAVDNWAVDKFKNNELKEINSYKARLITMDELENNLKYDYTNYRTTPYKWVYDMNINDTNQRYWTMSADGKNIYEVFYEHGGFNLEEVYNDSLCLVRPVINVYKNKIE